MLSEPEKRTNPVPLGNAGTLPAWLENPQRLRSLLSAVRMQARGLPPAPSRDVRLSEDDVVVCVRLLAQVGQGSRQVQTEIQAAELAAYFRRRLQGLPVELTVVLEDILGQVAGPLAVPLPVELSERLVQRLVLDSYQRGELSATEARALLERMSQETATLRRVLDVPVGHDYGEQLEAEFCASLAETKRRQVLLSPEAWCVPPRALRGSLEVLSREPHTAQAILEHYAGCVHLPESLARRRAAIVLGQLADSYAGYGGALLESAVRHAGSQLAWEPEPEIQELLATALARLTQAASAHRAFAALRQAVRWLEAVEAARPADAEKLRARIALPNHLRSFIEEAARLPLVPGEFQVLLRQVPGEAAELLCEAFEARSHRREQNRLLAMARELGPAATDRLRERLRSGAASAAVSTVGLLSRLEPVALEELLPRRLSRWDRCHHDRVVRLLASGGAPERGLLLLHLLDALDPLVLPGALDEIGMSGDPGAAARLMRIAGGASLQSSEPYLRVKALEALGRLRESATAPLLRRLVEAKGVWRWSEPREIRLAAAQALMKIDPAWAKKCLRRSGLQPAELAVGPLDPEPAAPWVRHRRYPRLPLPEKLPARARTLRGQWALATQVLSLGGGLAESPSLLPAGSELEVEIKAGRRPLRATALARTSRPGLLGFEIVRMNLEDRFRLRRLLAGLASAWA